MKLFVVTKTETETEAAFMMFNVVESGKAQKKNRFSSSYSQVQLRFKYSVTKSTTEGQAAFMLYNVGASGILLRTCKTMDCGKMRDIVQMSFEKVSLQ